MKSSLYKIGMIVAWKEGEKQRQGRVIQVYPKDRGVQVIPLDLEKPSYSIHIPTKEITTRGSSVDEGSLNPPVEAVRVDTIATIQEFCKDDKVTEVSGRDDPNPGTVDQSNANVGAEAPSSSSESVEQTESRNNGV